MSSRRRRDASGMQIKGSSLNEGGGSLADKFKNAVNAKTDRQDRLDKLDLAFKKASEKKKIEIEKFKVDIAKLLDSDEDEEIQVTRKARKEKREKGAKKPGSLKG